MDENDVKIFACAALVGLLAGRNPGTTEPSDAVAKEAVRIGMATAAACETATKALREINA